MTFEGFVSSIRESISDMVDGESSIKIKKVLKNNNVEYDALTIMDEGSNIAPTIYLNSYYDEFKEGKEISIIAKEIYSLYENHKVNLKFDIDLFQDFSKVKTRIAYKVINAKANEKLLLDIPHVPILDLAIVFYCIVDHDYLGSATALIHNIHMDMWNVTLEELYEIAQVNTPQIMTYEIKDMNQLIKEILTTDIQQTINERDNRYDENCNQELSAKVADGVMKDMNLKSSISMYVLTNKQRINGAVCMFYDGIIKEFADTIEEDIYIIPSSIHEVILVPAVEGVEEMELSTMVKEVNRDELDQEDILSDHVYLYSREKEEIIY